MRRLAAACPIPTENAAVRKDWRVLAQFIVIILALVILQIIRVILIQIHKQMQPPEPPGPLSQKASEWLRKKKR
jgi:hypothetical protein